MCCGRKRPLASVDKSTSRYAPLDDGQSGEFPAALGLRAQISWKCLAANGRSDNLVLDHCQTEPKDRVPVPQPFVTTGFFKLELRKNGVKHEVKLRLFLSPSSDKKVQYRKPGRVESQILRTDRAAFSGACAERVGSSARINALGRGEMSLRGNFRPAFFCRVWMREVV